MHRVFTNRPARLAVWSALAATIFAAPVMPAAQQAPLQCRPAAALVRVKELPEGSGLAASRRTRLQALRRFLTASASRTAASW